MYPFGRAVAPDRLTRLSADSVADSVADRVASSPVSQEDWSLEKGPALRRSSARVRASPARVEGLVGGFNVRVGDPKVAICLRRQRAGLRTGPAQATHLPHTDAPAYSGNGQFAAISER